MAEPVLVPSELQTVRDWLRFAVSKFNAAGLAYGHGTDNAVDEAAFLVLCALDLPIDDATMWLDARLTREERAHLGGLIEQRVVTRKPAAYLLQRAWLGPHRFYVDERVIVPRSFIAELLMGDLDALGIDAPAVTRVLDLCTGSGCLAIVAAHCFPQAQVDAVEIDAGACEVARKNIAAHRLQQRVHLHRGDLFAALPGPASYDFILSNPPYVTDASLAAFPPEHRAEPRLAHAGGVDGLDVVRRIMDAAREWLSEDGKLMVEVGANRAAVEAAYPALPLLWLDTAASEGEVFIVDRRSLGARTRARQPGGVKTRS